jgi:hypothetical protein
MNKRIRTPANDRVPCACAKRTHARWRKDELIQMANFLHGQLEAVNKQLNEMTNGKENKSAKDGGHVEVSDTAE